MGFDVVAGQEGHSRQGVQARSQPQKCRTCTGLGRPPAIQGTCALTATAPQGEASSEYFHSPDYRTQLLGNQLPNFRPYKYFLGMWLLARCKCTPSSAQGPLHIVLPAQVGICNGAVALALRTKLSQVGSPWSCKACAAHLPVATA